MRFKRPNPFDRFLGPEDIIQIQVCVYALLSFPGIKIHHSPNEGKRTPFERYKIAKLGVSRGFPDLLFIYKWKLAVLELKAGSNKPTPEQLLWIDAFQSTGTPSGWANSFEDAKKFLDTCFK